MRKISFPQQIQCKTSKKKQAQENVENIVEVVNTFRG